MRAVVLIIVAAALRPSAAPDPVSGSTSQTPDAVASTEAGDEAAEQAATPVFVPTDGAPLTVQVTRRSRYAWPATGEITTLLGRGATFEGKLAAFLVFAYGGPDTIMYTDGKMYDGVQDMVEAP